MKSFYFLFFCLFSLQIFAKATYKMNDLDALIQQHNDEEFFDHLYDIRPVERGEKWKDLVKKASDRFSLKLINQSKVTSEQFDRIVFLSKIPFLSKDDLFKARLTEIAKKFFVDFLKEEPLKGQSKILQFWSEVKRTSDMAMELYEIIPKINLSQKDEWSFLTTIVKDPLSEFFCQRQTVMTPLWQKLSLDMVTTLQEDKLKYLDTLLHPNCQKSLINEAKKRMLDPKNRSDREISYYILKSLLKLSSLDQSFFYLSYLLDNPPKGELFNYSWNDVKALGQKPERRDELLKIFESLTFFPDETIASIDQKKTKTILFHIKRYFPELIQLYSRKCMDYYLGKKIYSQGNPTLNCSKLIESNYSHEILSSEMIIEIKKAKEIK